MPRAFVLALMPVVALWIGCSSKSPESATAQSSGSDQPTVGQPVVTPTSATSTRPKTDPPADPIVVLHSSLGDIKVRLFADKAPRTVDNFLHTYAERGFYDQTIFHHVEPGQMLIAGGYTTELERKALRAPIYNESRNGVANRRGTIAMAREPESPHSATADFFFNLADNEAFNYRADGEDEQHGYCVFGEVVSGMEIVERIAQQSTIAKADFPQIPSPTATILSIDRVQ